MSSVPSDFVASDCSDQMPAICTRQLEPPITVESTSPAGLRAVQPADSEIPALSDQTLIDGGLAPVRARMRMERTPNAKRVAAARDRKEKRGIRQLNVQAPVELHGLLKAVAKATTEQSRQIAQVLAGDTMPANDAEHQRRQASLATAPSAVLARIDEILAHAWITPIDPAAEERRKRERRAQIQIGRSIAALHGWRRWVVFQLAGLPNRRRSPKP